MGTGGVGVSVGGADAGVGSSTGNSVCVAVGSGVLVEVAFGAIGDAVLVGVGIIEATGTEVSVGRGL